MKKSSCTPSNPKNYSCMLWPKKIHTRNLITKKTPAAQKCPSLHNFSNGPSLKRHQNGISALVSQTSFRGETVSGVAKCRLFSQVNEQGSSIVFGNRELSGNGRKLLFPKKIILAFWSVPFFFLEKRSCYN